MGLPIWIRIFFIPVLFIGLLLIVKFILSIRKSMWKRRMLNMPSKESVEGIYGRINKLLCKIGMGIKNYETPSIYSIRVLEEIGLQLDDVSEIFVRAKYGGIEPTISDVKLAMETYMEVEKDVKKRVGKLKSIFI